MKNIGKIVLLVFFLLSNSYSKDKEELVFYIGITMVKPVDVLAKEFEKENNCKIKILQGGSQDLYNSIKSSKIGDLYLPGSTSYRTNNLKDGLISSIEVDENKIITNTKYQPKLNKIYDEDEKPQGKYLSAKAYKVKLEKR